MGETIIFVAAVNAVMAAAFVAAVLGISKWSRIGSPSWIAWLSALHAELIVSFAFNYHYLATGEAFGFDMAQAMSAAWGIYL